MKTGQRIREIRLHKGMTQEELSSITGISTRTIQRIELGKVEPRAYTLQTIADALEVNYEELINNNSGQATFQYQENKFWLPMMHLSGLFILLIPPLIIWFLKKDKIENIREQGVDVINFQLSMLLIIIPSGILAFLLITIPILLFIGVFSTVIIIINTIRVTNGQPYKYPMSINFLKR